MHKFLKVAFTLAFAATFASAQYSGSHDGKYYWDDSHRSYTPWHDNFCKLQLERIYQPEGGSQPIHLVIKNVSSNRLQYSASIRVGNFDAGSILVDNANPGESSERDANKRFPGTLGGSRVTITVRSCSIRS